MSKNFDYMKTIGWLLATPLIIAGIACWVMLVAQLTWKIVLYAGGCTTFLAMSGAVLKAMGADLPSNNGDN